MRKVFSFAAAIVAAMVIMVSCAAPSQNTKDSLAILDNIQAGNSKAVDSLVNMLYSVKNELTADEALGVLCGMNYLANVYSSQNDAASASMMAKNLIDLYETAITKPDATATFNEAKSQGVDIENLVAKYKAQFEAAAQMSEE